MTPKLRRQMAACVVTTDIWIYLGFMKTQRTDLANTSKSILRVRVRLCFPVV